MNIERNNDTEFEVEYVEENVQQNAKKNNKFQLFIFLGCLVLAFLVWCYANYLDDPIVQKEVDLIITLVNPQTGDAVKQSSQTIWIYGEESVLENIHVSTNQVNRNKFSGYDSTVDWDIELPDDVHTHDGDVKLTLVYNSENELTLVK